MKKIIVSVLVFASMLFAGNMQNNHMGHAHAKAKHMKMFQSVPMNKATILQDGDAKLYCPSCGMTLPMFYKTNHAATLHGKVKQFCSLHCLVETNLNNHNKLKDIKVVDVTSLKFIDASSATYVVGSSKKGTMTMNSKYAFAKKVDAEAFAKKFGGKVMSFKEAYDIASNALVKEVKMIAKKQAMMAKKGAMIYNKMCKKTDIKFSSTAQAKAYVTSHNLCGNLKGKKLQAVGLYLSKR
jgi:nitrous oxide reductase accessory protein NosL